ncbi:15400_t:CDS:2, partial [Acaulospora morrowiae]
YIYTGAVDIKGYDIKDIICLMVEAKKLILPDLIDYIRKYLTDHQEFVANHYFSIHEFNIRNSEEFNELEELCDAFILRYSVAILNSPEFLNISHEELLRLYKKIFSNCTPLNDFNPISGISFSSDIVMWSRLLEWVFVHLNISSSETSDEDYNEIMQLVKPVLPYINFRRIDSRDFLEKISPFKKILENEFYIKILEFHIFSEFIRQESELQPEHETKNEPNEKYFGGNFGQPTVLAKAASQDKDL